MLLTVCIEAGRETLTHTSWIGLTPASRKWMSGQAAALAATQDRTQFANFSASHPLRDPALPSVRIPPSPLDFYLSWMSPNFLPSEPIPAVWNFIRSSLLSIRIQPPLLPYDYNLTQRVRRTRSPIYLQY